MSKCLHDYQFILESPNGIVEKCKLCKKRLVTNKGIRGKIDNKKYLKEHRRDFLQPTGRTAKDFKSVYGEFDNQKVRKNKPE